jgi:ferredoxin
MTSKIILEKDIGIWIDAIIKTFECIAPQKIGEKEYAFLPLKTSGDISLDFINPIVSPAKEFLLPCKETVINYSKKNGSFHAESAHRLLKTVIFGIRSCDLSAVEFTDRFFLDGFKDSIYSDKRENLYLVSLVCNTPFDSCFCVCADCGPAKETGFDIQLTKLNGEYLVEVGTKKGEELINLAAAYFKNAEDKHTAKKELIVKNAKESFKLPTTYFSKAIQHVTAGDVDEKAWERLASRCLTCGSCSFVCPTCTCFNVTDEVCTDEKGERCRSWDSCMYAGFAREVSGHNPRKLRKERVKRRFYHKLSYYYVKKMGQHGCVGCGRCVTACMGGIDMPAVCLAARRESGVKAEGKNG